MAIKYTYSFNCIIKYRFSDEAVNIKNPRFDDSSFIYSCESEEGVGNIKIPLPNYLQGSEKDIRWYLDDSYTEEKIVTSNDELISKNWKLSDKKQNGTFTSYTAVIILYSNSVKKDVTWTYKEYTEGDSIAEKTVAKTYWNNENPAEDHPQISNVLYTTENGVLYSYTFLKWILNANSYIAEYAKVKHPINSLYTSEDNGIKYNIFKDAEPYHYGLGYPDKDIFKPIGDDEDPLTDEYKVQRYNPKDSFVEYGEIQNFKLKGSPLKYIKKGTFPKAGDNNKTGLSSWSSSSMDLVIKYDNNKKIESINAGSSSYNLNYWIDRHGLEDFPRRLGFILVGAGGGGGGWSWYDENKDGKTTTRYCCPGGGGGGGETVWGVLNFDYPQINYNSSTKKYSIPGVKSTTIFNEEPIITKVTFTISFGNRGSSGTNATTEGVTHNKPKSGTSGGNGGDSTIRVSITYKTSSTSSSTKVATTEHYITAKGGAGGGAGHWENSASGGNGGTNGATTASSPYFWICGRKNGSAGANAIRNTTSYVDPYSFDIYFSKDTPTDDSYCVRISHPQLATQYGGVDNNFTNQSSILVPGGHSLFCGQSISNSGSSSDYGRGGACCYVSFSGSGGAYFYY